MRIAVHQCSDSTYLNNVADWLCGSSGPFLVHLDIKPGSCPNPLNVKAPKKRYWDEDDTNTDLQLRTGKRALPPMSFTSVIPAAVLGTVDFDVLDIDLSSITLAGVPPVRYSVADVAAPLIKDLGKCACAVTGRDGYDDLTLKFNKWAIVQVLGEVYDGDTIPLTITGQLQDGTPFEGTDCVVIRNGEDLPEDLEVIAGGGEPSLLGNFPNPFNPTTSIAFSLPEAAEVSVSVYNTLGRQVARLADGHYEAGLHVVEWNAGDLASGVYLYRLEAAGVSTTRKMLLLK
jgi:hypothetical protein